MPLDDLCLLSRTCKRLQALCESHFRRKYPNKANTEVQVGIGFDGKLRISPYENYVKCFYKFVKNVHIYVWTFQQEDFEDEEINLPPVLNFIKTKCDKNLHRIVIEENIALVPFCKKIKKFLRSVEIVQFMNRNENGQNEVKFLNYCPNVTKLILQDGVNDSNALLQQRLSKLKHFYYINSFAVDLNTEKLRTFFQKNDNIRSVAWRFDYSDEEARALACIQTVDYTTNLEHLFLLICSLLAERFSIICSYLYHLCNRGKFKLLEIEFERLEGAAALKSNVNSLVNLNQLTKIHLSSLRLSEVMPALRSLVHLKVIILNYLSTEDDWDEWLDSDNLTDLVDKTQNMDLPHIEEVHLVDIDDEQVYIYVLLLIRHWVHLKRMLHPASYNNGTKFHVDMLDRERKKLKDACKLTILTNHDGNEANMAHDLVKLKVVEFEYDCNTKNATAFQKYYMKSQNK